MALSNRMIQFITPFIEQIQEIEYVFRDLKLYRDITNGVGAQLDGIGDILDEPRNGLSDTDYRLKLRLKIYINQSSGQAEPLIRFLRDLTESPNIHLVEQFPASIRMYFNGSLDLGSLIKPTVKKYTAAGIGVELIYLLPGTNYFGFADEGGFESDGFGFLELNYDEIVHGYTAGIYSELIQ